MTKSTENATKAKVNPVTDSGTKAVNVTSAIEGYERTRHFYAQRPTAKGKQLPYAFDRKEARDKWVEQNDSAQAIAATTAYALLGCKPTGNTLITKRGHRVYQIDDISQVDLAKGHKVISLAIAS